MSPVRSSAKLREHAAAPLSPRRLGRAPAVEQAVVGDHREVELGRDEPVWSLRLAASVIRPAVRRRAILPSPSQSTFSRPRLYANRSPSPRRANVSDRAVAGAGELLELGLGLLEPAGGDVGGLGAERERLVLVDARQADPGPLVRAAATISFGRDVQVVGVLVVEGRGHVLPVVGERRRDLLVAGDQHGRVRADQLQERVEVLDREQLGDVRPLRRVLQRRDLGQLAVLGGQLGRRRHLDQPRRRRASAG